VVLTLNGSMEGCTSLVQLLGRLLPDETPLTVLRLHGGIPNAAASAGGGGMLSSVRQLNIDMSEDHYGEFVGNAEDVDALLAQMPQLQRLEVLDLKDNEEGFDELSGLS
jgi:hypothetical protein